jgi:hypothetical protein
LVSTILASEVRVEAESGCKQMSAREKESEENTQDDSRGGIKLPLL